MRVVKATQRSVPSHPLYFTFGFPNGSNPMSAVIPIFSVPDGVSCTPRETNHKDTTARRREYGQSALITVNRLFRIDHRLLESPSSTSW